MESKPDYKKLVDSFVKSLEWMEIRSAPATLFQDGQALASGIATVGKFQVTFVASEPEHFDFSHNPSLVLKLTNTNILLLLTKSLNTSERRLIFDIVGMKRET